MKGKNWPEIFSGDRLFTEQEANGFASFLAKERKKSGFRTI